MGLMSIYNKAPIWAQNIFTTIQGMRYKKQRFGEAYYTYLEELKKSDITKDCPATLSFKTTRTYILKAACQTTSTS